MYRKEGYGIGDGINLNRLLSELHAKRAWLDQIIRGLEEVEKSPEIALVTAVEEVLSRDWTPKPNADLGSKEKARLIRLASRVTARTQGGRRFQTTEHNAPA